MLSAGCPGCEFRINLGPATCEAVIFDKAIGFSYLRIECPRPQCEASWCVFISAFVENDDYRKIKAIVEEIMTSGMAFELASAPGPNVLSDWAEAHDEDPVEFHELLPRHLELIEALGVTLALTPDHHLMDIFSSPPPRSQLPMKWS